MAEQWILDITEELQLPRTAPDQYTKSIYCIPKIITDVNSTAYEPKLASFGPYHHNRRHLRPMEQHKNRAVLQFLRRISKASKTREDVLVAMRNVESALLASYDSLRIHDDGDCLEQGRFRHHDWLEEKDEFLKIMIVDSCFALEIMLVAQAVDERDPYEASPGSRICS